MKIAFKTGNHHGFSLVEVVIAIGIVSFAVLAIMGLLPTGLKTVKNSNEQAAAANVACAIAEAIRAGSSSWTYDETTNRYDNNINVMLTNLTLEGVRASGNADPRFTAVVVFSSAPTIAPPPASLGSAMISVAWPSGARPNPANGSPNWSGSDGAVTVGIQFLLR
jgi:uncharacterized protein (TIGR02598 family)